jgi:hypothetical protein
MIAPPYNKMKTRQAVKNEKPAARTGGLLCRLSNACSVSSMEHTF